MAGPCSGTGDCADWRDARVERCVLEVDVEAGATTSVRSRARPGGGCTADVAADAVAAGAWPATIVRVDAPTGAIRSEAPSEQGPDAHLLGVVGDTPVLLVRHQSASRLLLGAGVDVLAGAVVDGQVVATLPSGHLVGLDAGGQERWRRPGDGSAPIGGAGVGLVQLGLEPVGSAESIGIDLLTGAERWRAPVAAFMPFAHDGLVYVQGRIDGSSTWIGLDPATGEQRTSLRIAGEAGAGPVSTGDLVAAVVVEADDTVVVALRGDGEVAWRRPLPNAWGGRLVAAGGVVVVPVGGSVVALDAATGRELWRLAGSPRVDERLADPVAVGDEVLLLRS